MTTKSNIMFFLSWTICLSKCICCDDYLIINKINSSVVAGVVADDDVNDVLINF